MSNDTDLILTNPFTGTPLKQAPDGTSLEGVSFKTRAELDEFVNRHWDQPPVEMVEVPSKS